MAVQPQVMGMPEDPNRVMQQAQALAQERQKLRDNLVKDVMENLNQFDQVRAYRQSVETQKKQVQWDQAMKMLEPIEEQLGGRAIAMGQNPGLYKYLFKNILEMTDVQSDVAVETLRASDLTADAQAKVKISRFWIDPWGTDLSKIPLPEDEQQGLTDVDKFDPAKFVEETSKGELPKAPAGTPAPAPALTPTPAAKGEMPSYSMGEAVRSSLAGTPVANENVVASAGRFRFKENIKKYAEGFPAEIQSKILSDFQEILQSDVASSFVDLGYTAFGKFDPLQEKAPQFQKNRAEAIKAFGQRLLSTDKNVQKEMSKALSVLDRAGVVLPPELKRPADALRNSSWYKRGTPISIKEGNVDDGQNRWAMATSDVPVSSEERAAMRASAPDHWIEGDVPQYVDMPQVKLMAPEPAMVDSTDIALRDARPWEIKALESPNPLQAQKAANLIDKRARVIENGFQTLVAKLKGGQEPYPQEYVNGQIALEKVSADKWRAKYWDPSKFAKELPLLMGRSDVWGAYQDMLTLATSGGEGLNQKRQIDNVTKELVNNWKLNAKQFDLAVRAQTADEWFKQLGLALKFMETEVAQGAATGGMDQWAKLSFQEYIKVRDQLMTKFNYNPVKVADALALLERDVPGFKAVSGVYLRIMSTLSGQPIGTRKYQGTPLGRFFSGIVPGLFPDYKVESETLLTPESMMKAQAAAMGGSPEEAAAAQAFLLKHGVK